MLSLEMCGVMVLGVLGGLRLHAPLTATICVFCDSGHPKVHSVCVLLYVPHIVSYTLVLILLVTAGGKLLCSSRR